MNEEIKKLEQDSALYQAAIKTLEAREIAKLTGTNLLNVLFWKRGVYNPPIDKQKKIEEYFKSNYGWKGF